MNNKPNINLIYILIVVVLASVAGGIIDYQYRLIPIIPTITNTTPQLTPNGTSNWNTYRNEKYGFEVQYPNGWEVFEENDEAEGWFGFDKESITKAYAHAICLGLGCIAPGVSIGLYPNKDLNNYLKGYREGADIWHTYKVIKEDTVNIGGQEFLRLLTEIQTNPTYKEFSYFNNVQKINGFIYWLVTFEEKDEIKYESIVEKMIPTFRFIK